MTPLTKAQIEAVLAGATPGPWYSSRDNMGFQVRMTPEVDYHRRVADIIFWPEKHTGPSANPTELQAERNAALIAASPDLARTAIALHDRVAELERALRCFLADDRFQVAVGGNPNVVEAMISATRATLERTTP